MVAFSTDRFRIGPCPPPPRRLESFIDTDCKEHTMADLTTLTGTVATDPRHVTTNSGLDIVHFRLASPQRRYDRAKDTWVETETNWYTVTAFRQLATNIASSVLRGQRIVVSGRIRVRSWENGEKSGTTVEIEADAVGHDLSWGTSIYRKSVHSGAPSGDAVVQQEFASAGTAQPEFASAGTPQEFAAVGADSQESPGAADRQPAEREPGVLVPF